MGLFITFEGPDGSGKSTQARLLAVALRDVRIDVLETREPGGTQLGEGVRSLFLSNVVASATPLAMALLLSSSRAELVAQVIRPALAAGKTVVADRFADSTIAYQAYGLGLERATAVELARIATGGLRPDVSIYVDIDPDMGMARSARRTDGDWLDTRTRDFHVRVRQGYLDLIADDPQRWICVDGSGTPEAIHDAILRQLRPLLERTEDSA